jgi:hypothetical protein
MPVSQVVSVRGPRTDRIHYVYGPPNTAEVWNPALCGRDPPRLGWTPTSDQQNNRSSWGFCQTCLNRLVGPQH